MLSTCTLSRLTSAHLGTAPARSPFRSLAPSFHRCARTTNHVPSQAVLLYWLPTSFDIAVNWRNLQGFSVC